MPSGNHKVKLLYVKLVGLLHDLRVLVEFSDTVAGAFKLKIKLTKKASFNIPPTSCI